MPTLSVASGPVAIGGRHVVASVRSYTSIVGRLRHCRRGNRRTCALTTA